MQLDDAKGVVKVLYHSQQEYERITGRLRMLREWKVCCGTVSCCLQPRMFCCSSRFSALRPSAAHQVALSQAPTRILCKNQMVAIAQAQCMSNLRVPLRFAGGRAARRVPWHGAGLAAGWGGAAVHRAGARLQVGQAGGGDCRGPHGRHQTGADDDADRMRTHPAACRWRRMQNLSLTGQC